jgi:hypothetical protein
MNCRLFAVDAAFTKDAVAVAGPYENVTVGGRSYPEPAFVTVTADTTAAVTPTVTTQVFPPPPTSVVLNAVA